MGNKMSIQLVFLYLKPDCDVKLFKRSIQLIQDKLNTGMPFILMGDTNLNVNDPSKASRIDHIEDKLHCRQMVREPTTDFDTILDHVYTNLNNMSVGTIDCYWSDHKFICVTIKPKRRERENDNQGKTFNSEETK